MSAFISYFNPRRFLYTVAVLLVATLPALAQETGEAGKSFWADPLSHPMLPFYIMIAFMFMVMITVVIVAIYILRVLNIFIRKAAEEKAAKLGIAYVPEPSWWQRLNNRITNSVPVERETTILLDHNYDGIRELDNHLPPWWKWLFYISIVWAGVYLVAYHITDSLPLMEEEYNIELANAVKEKPAGPVIDETNITLSTDAAVLQSGKEIFLSNCASCHKPDGGGGIGPNLTDAYWLHGGSISDVFHTITEGVPNTNMISWKASISPEKRRDVANFVMSLQGTTPADAKAPQGELYKPAAESAKADSIQVQAAL